MMKKEVNVITKIYESILWVLPKLETFPRS